jgi:prephenate dehydrogenase
VIQFDRAVIVGVGLLGGSIGMALRSRKIAKKVIGFSPRGNSLDSAITLGAIDLTANSLDEACRGADLAIVCTPVQSVADFALQCFAAMRSGCLITDVGSTKQSIVDAVARSPAAAVFVGSHPLAGSEKSGVEHARENLLEGKLVVITPHQSTSPTRIQAAEELWRSLGARTLQFSPSAHDSALARTSHLPHILASALAAATPADLLPLAASGWRDTTRVASGGADLWRQILEENRQPVIKVLEEFASDLQQWLKALRESDGQQLEQLLLEGKQKRDALGN